MAAFEDSFVDTGNTALSAHTPDVGTAWTLVTGAVETFQINAGGTRLQSVNTVDNDAYHIDDLGSADHVTIFRVADTPQSSNHRTLYASVRLTDHNNFIAWRWFGTGLQGSRLTKCNAGSLTDLIQVDGAESTIRNGWVKIETEGDTIRLFHGGTGASPVWTEVGSVTETFNNAVTRQGLAKNGSTSVLDYIQYFEADVFGGVSNDIAASGTITWAGAAATTATGALAVTGVLAWTSAADLSGAVDQDISATGLVSWTGSAVLSATGTLAAADASVWTDSAALTATGALDAIGSVAWANTASLSGAGALTADGAITWTPTVDLSATGSLGATGAVTWTSTADLQSPTINDIAATGSVAVTGAADLSGAGALAATATATVTAAADLSATGVLAGTGATAWTGTAVLDTPSELIARGDILISATALLRATGTIGASAALSWAGEAVLTGGDVSVFEDLGFNLQARHGFLLQARHGYQLQRRHGFLLQTRHTVRFQ